MKSEVINRKTVEPFPLYSGVETWKFQSNKNKSTFHKLKYLHNTTHWQIMLRRQQFHVGSKTS